MTSSNAFHFDLGRADAPPARRVRGIQRLKSFAKRLLRRNRLPESAKQDEQIYSIGMYAGTSPCSLHPAASVTNPVLTAQDVSDVPAAFVADPFMCRTDTAWNMFFEVMNRASSRGEIALATSPDGLRWQYQCVVLAEPFHLSYPYVFEWLGEHYMIPESYQARSVRLYRAVDFPRRWRFEATLVEGADFVDASIVQYRGLWWLFAALGRPPFRADMLHLFHASELTGPWRPHPHTPVVDNNARIARPAGRILAMDDRLLRYAQDCSQTYGRSVQAVDVVALTPTAYRERVSSPDSVLSPGGAAWNAEGMHHVDPHPLEDGTWLACVDGCFLLPATAAGSRSC